MFRVTNLSEHDNCIISSFLCLKFHLHRYKFQQTNPNFVAFLNLVRIKRNTEYKIAENNGKLRQHFKKWTLNLEASNFSGLFLFICPHITIPTFLICVQTGELCVSVVRAFLLGASACLSLSSVFCFVCLFFWRVDYSLFPFLEKTMCLGYC